MSASAGATNATARHRPSPTTSAAAPSARFAALFASSSLLAALVSPDDAAPLPLTPSAGGNLVRPADDGLHALRVAGRRAGRALPADDVERGLLQRLRHPRVRRETGPERG